MSLAEHRLPIDLEQLVADAKAGALGGRVF